MKIICDYFEKHRLNWKKLVGFSNNGLAKLVKEKNSDTVTIQSIIHRQELATKPKPDLLIAMKLAIKIVNSVKGSAKHTCIFKKLCAESARDTTLSY